MRTALLCGIPLLLSIANSGFVARGDDEATKRDILSTLQAQAAAWNAGDIPGFMDGYVRSDSLRFASGGTVRRGWQTTLERFQQRYHSRELMGTLEFSNFEVLLISDDVAEVFGSFRLSRSESVGDSSGLFTLLMKRVNGRWLVFHDHTSAAEPADATDDQAYEVPADVRKVLDAVDREINRNTPTDSDTDIKTMSEQQLSTVGDLAFFSGDFQSAVAAYNAMIDRNPSLESSHWRLGIALYYDGQPAAGARVFDKYHSFDQVDRENGIWRYLCHYRAFGPEPAREQLLKYEKDDRPPFPLVYQLFEGQLTEDAVIAGIPDKLSDSDRQARLFYAHLYAGLNATVTGRTPEARRHLEKMIVNKWPRTAGFGPNYMWHVGRVQYLQLLD